MSRRGLLMRSHNRRIDHHVQVLPVPHHTSFADTRLAVAPFWSLSSDGAVCTGSMCRPESASVAAISSWEQGFYVIIALIGIIVDLTGRHDYLAMVYPLRALILCVVIVVLIARWERKSKVEPSQVR
jgi:hypothetical protein